MSAVEHADISSVVLCDGCAVRVRGKDHRERMMSWVPVRLE